MARSKKKNSFTSRNNDVESTEDSVRERLLPDDDNGEAASAATKGSQDLISKVASIPSLTGTAEETAYTFKTDPEDAKRQAQDDKEQGEPHLNPARQYDSGKMMYEPFASSDDAGWNRRHKRKTAKNLWWLLWVTSIVLIVLMCILAILRAIQYANEYPRVHPHFPQQFEASVVIHMPYMDLHEPLYVQVNEPKGLQKLSYYGDTDVYIYDLKEQESYQIIPVIHKMKCFKSEFKERHLQRIFPNMTGFEPQYGLFHLDGKKCHAWKYKTRSKTQPDANGLMGEYTLYVDWLTNVPVRLHFIGRNGFFGGSHMDEYTLDYLYLRENPVDKHVFSALPSLMKCEDMKKYQGPARDPLRDIQMLMPEGESTKETVFDEFQQQFGKFYGSEEEKLQRKLIFEQNLRYINTVNRQGLSYHLAVNHFADLSRDELRLMRSPKLKREHDNGAARLHELSSSSPEKDQDIDWRKKGAVTPVKDQGICGSCWTFGTTGALEGALFRHNKTVVPLSQQNLMDCSWKFGNLACNGGFDYQAYKYILEAGGLEATSTYGGYRNAPGFCHFNHSQVAVQMKEFVNVTGMTAFNDALHSIGPLSVSVDASLPSFYFYAGGLYRDTNCSSDLDSLDHSVLAVGVTTVKGEKYTILKNSWSTHWGEEGYMRIAQKDNLCGVATAATYPVLV